MSIVYFEVSFPPGQVLPVDVSYAMQPSKAEENGQIYRYNLSTGRGWAGTIGQADIVVTFPSEILQGTIVESPPGSQLDGKQLLWVKKDFEPVEADNFWVQIQSPVKGLDASVVPTIPGDKWINMVAAQLGIERQPEQWQSWEYLADSYCALATIPCPNCVSRDFIDHFAEVGRTAYHQSAKLNPNQRAPFIGLAKLMLLQENWSSLPETRETILTTYVQELQLPPSEDSYFAEIENQNLEEIYSSLLAGLTQGTKVPISGQSLTLQPIAAITTLTVPSTTLHPVATIAPTKTPLASAAAGVQRSIEWVVAWDRRNRRYSSTLYHFSPRHPYVSIQF